MGEIEAIVSIGVEFTLFKLLIFPSLESWEKLGAESEESPVIPYVDIGPAEFPALLIALCLGFLCAFGLFGTGGFEPCD